MAGKQKRKNTKSRCLRLESLETRELLSATSGSWYELSDFTGHEPTAAEQEMLARINYMRTIPAEQYADLIKVADASKWNDTTGWSKSCFDTYSNIITQICQGRYPAGSKEQLQSFIDDWNALLANGGVAPLAYSTTLLQVSSDYNNYMKTHQQEITGGFEHNAQLEELLGNNFTVYGENVYAAAIPSAYNESVAYFMHTAFAIDWGNDDASHRANIMNKDYTEVGVSILNPSGSDSKYYTTIDFGASANPPLDGAYLLGSVFSDNNLSGIYDSGEGLGGVSLVIRKTDTSSSLENSTVSIDTLHAGGYQIFLQNGTYTVTAAKGSNYHGTVTKTFTIDGSNVKIDFLTSDYNPDAPLVDLGGGAYYDYGVFPEFHEGSTAISVTSNATLSDRQGKIQSITIKFASDVNLDKESINITGTSNYLTINKNYTTDGSLTITSTNGDVDINEFQQLLRTLTYVCTAGGNEFPLDERIISIQAFDGANKSNLATVTITMTPLAPVLTIENAKTYEGDDGTRTMEFEARLSFAASEEVGFSCSTVAGTASEGDYLDQTQKIVFAPGETSKKFSVTIYGNYTPQSHETESGTTYNSVYHAEDDLYFKLNVFDLNGVAFRNREVQGIILDDDTPDTVITGTTSWSQGTILSYQTDYGTRRFLYGVVAESNGIMTWSAAGDLPSGFTLSVYEEHYSETPLSGVTVKQTTTGQTAQWTVTAGKKYIVKVESTGAATLSNQQMRLLELTTDNMVMIDPLWEKVPADQRVLVVNPGDNGINFGVGQNLWSLPSLEEGGYRFMSMADNASILFQLDGDKGKFSSGINQADDMSDYYYNGVGNELTLSGFASMLIVGNDNNEEIEFAGSTGNDTLEFSQGEGKFTVAADDPQSTHIYYFRRVTTISFDAGSAGKDTATLIDSLGNDSVNMTTTGKATLSGGGYSVSISNFQTVQLILLTGGKNTVTMSSPEEETEETRASAHMYINNNNMIYLTTLTNKNSARTEETSLLVTIDGYTRFSASSESVIDAVYVLGPANHYETSPGTLVMSNSVYNVTNELYNVRKIIFWPVLTPTAEEFKLKINSDCVIETDEESGTATLSLTTGTVNYSISMPLEWYHQIGPYTTEPKKDAVLPVKPVAAALPVLSMDEVFTILADDEETCQEEKPVIEKPTTEIIVSSVIPQKTRFKAIPLKNIDDNRNQEIPAAALDQAIVRTEPVPIQTEEKLEESLTLLLYGKKENNKTAKADKATDSIFDQEDFWVIG